MVPLAAQIEQFFFFFSKWEVQDTDAMSSSIQCRDIAMPPKCFSKEIIRCAIRLRRIFFFARRMVLMASEGKKYLSDNRENQLASTFACPHGHLPSIIPCKF